MRLVLILVSFSACVTTPLPPAPTPYPARPATVSVRDSGAFNRALQVALTDGFQATKTDAATGLFMVERMLLDAVLTEERADHWVGGPAPPDYFRRCVITAIVGTHEATVSPSVSICRDNHNGTPRCGPAEPALNLSEDEALRRILNALSPPPKPEAKKPSSDI